MERTSLWTLYTSLEGRISRRTVLLWFFLPITLTQILAGFADMSLGYEITNDLTKVGPWSIAQRLLTLWPGAVGLVKRLHDLEMPGKYVAAFYGSVLLAGVLLFNARASEGVGPDSVVGWAVGTLCALYLMYLFIICCFRRGIDGPNKYGPDPLEKSPAIWV